MNGSMNTKIHYLYRDADNYKVHNSCVIKGVLTPEQINVILSCCDAGEYFIPNQVGLPERKFEKIDPQVDHCWFELTRDDFEYTDQPANVPVTAQQLTDHFIAAKDSWNDCEFFEQSDQNITDLHILHEKANAVGKYATADLAVGDYIINTKISDVPAADNAYLYDLDGSQQAISVTIRSFANGLSGKLQSGDIVSVVAPDYKQQGQTVIPPELQYVEVISVTASTGYDANTGEAQTDDEDGKELPSTVTLLVTPEQSKVLAELEEEGTIHLTLVYRGSKENAEKFLSAQDDVLLEI